MSMVTEEQVLSLLKAVKYPGFSRDIVSFGIVKEVRSHEGELRIRLVLTSPKPEVASQLQKDCEAALKTIPGVTSVIVEVLHPGGQVEAPRNPWEGQQHIPGIKHVVAIASGKGGVGKSTVAVNLACALSQLGAKTGLLDCDIYGPSVPLMMGVNQRPTVTSEEKLAPLINHGVRLMSIGFLLDADTPVIWRGPMIVKTIQQFLGAVEWGELDYLLVDLPPGTGDAQLTLCQTVPLDGGLIVTTPQEASLGVVRKGIGMFVKVNVPLLGIVENMSYYTTPSGERVDIFGHGGGKQEAQRQKIDFLGEVPIFTEIREGGDKGVPVVISHRESAPGQAFINVAKALHTKLN